MKFMSAKDKINISYASVSETGSREVNEDCISITKADENFCFIVCDGLGGHGKGEVASELVTKEISRCFEENGKEADFFDMAFQKAQEKLLEEQVAQSSPSQMKTTAVALRIIDGVASWCHIGDSRLYFFRKSKLKSRTIDHSVVQLLALSKEIKEKEIRFHPDRNMLLKVMGTEWTGDSYVISEKAELKKGDAFLLCSDGFWEFIEEKKMAVCLKKSENAQEWLEKMVKEVELNGDGKETDNYSAIAVTV